MCRRRIEGGKKKSSSAVAPIPNDLTGLRSLPSIWGNGFSLDRTGREPCGLVVVEGDQKTLGVRGEPLRVLFSALLSPRPDSGLCGVGRQKRPFCSTHSLCAHVWLACEPAKSESKAGQRATGKTGSVEVAQLAAARFFFFFFFRTARDGHVHTGDPSAADANMSPTLR